jgi:hypothetical protein
VINLFVVFNVQINDLFAIQKNEIDHGFTLIDKHEILIGEGYFVDNECVLKAPVGQKWRLIGNKQQIIGFKACLLILNEY